MMHTRPVSPDLDRNAALVRALRSLRIGDAEIITKIVESFEGCWSIQTCDDYDGYLFMLIEPSNAETECLPTYMVSGKTGEVELCLVKDDHCQTITRFSDIYGLAAELAERLLKTAGQFPPGT